MTKYISAIILCFLGFNSHSATGGSPEDDAVLRPVRRLQIMAESVEKLVEEGRPSHPLALVKLEADPKEFTDYLEALKEFVRSTCIPAAPNASKEKEEADKREVPEISDPLVEGRSPGKLESITPEISKAAAHAFSYLLHAGYPHLARTYFPLVDRLLTETRHIDMNDLNYPGTKYEYKLTQTDSGISTFMRGTSPSFTTFGWRRLPYSYECLLVGNGWVVPNTSCLPDFWYTIDTNPRMYPDMAGDVFDPRVLALFGDNQLRLALLEHVTWCCFNDSEEETAGLFDNFKRILKPGGVLMLLDSTCKTHKDAETKWGLRCVKVQEAGKKSGLIVAEANILRGKVFNPYYQTQYFFPYIVFVNPGDDKFMKDNLDQLKHLVSSKKLYAPSDLPEGRQYIFRKFIAECETIVPSIKIPPAPAH